MRLSLQSPLFDLWSIGICVPEFREELCRWIDDIKEYPFSRRFYLQTLGKFLEEPVVHVLGSLTILRPKMDSHTFSGRLTSAYLGI